ncbi:MAG: hypothetical protein EON52_13770 [Actinomycetales bacterium]|nr:MAG: hypothetical protein EON52_13770 [Actinomycetales bacterium]
MTERNSTPESTIDEDAFDLDEERFGRQDADLEQEPARLSAELTPLQLDRRQRAQRVLRRRTVVEREARLQRELAALFAATPGAVS